MNLTRTLPVVFLALVVGLAPGQAQTAPAPSPATAAPSSADAVVKLPQFTVSSQSMDEFHAEEVESAARVAAPIMDTPLTVNVVTPALIEDIGPDATSDVTQYFSGVSPGRGTGATGVQDRQDFRGFESFSKTIDNFSSFQLPLGTGFNATFDPAFIASAELVMGPDSILAPTGSPGGSVNLITKSPSFDAGTDVSVEAGNYNAQRTTIDTTGPLGDGKHMAYRLIGVGQDTQTYVPGRLEQVNLAAEFEYLFTPTSKLTVKYFNEFWELEGSVANANDNGEQVWTPNTIRGATLSDSPQPGWTYDSSDANASWSSRVERLSMLNAEFTTTVGDNINARLAASFSNSLDYYIAAYPKSAPSETFNPMSGQVIAVSAINPASLPMIGTYSDLHSRQIQVQNDYAGNFQAGPVSLKPVAGFAAQYGRTTNISLLDTSLPNGNVLAGNYPVAQPPLAAFNSLNAFFPETATLFQGYATTTAGFFGDRAFLMGGVSRTWATVDDYSFKGAYISGVGQVGAAPGTANYRQDFTFNNTGSVVAPTQKDYHDTYLAGALVKVLPDLSIYTSYSSNAGIAANNPLWQAGTQVEFGAKAEFLDKRITVTAAHFQIIESNVASANPLFNAGLSSQPSILTDETNHGEEFDVTGGITRNLSVIGSFTEMHLRDAFGRRLRNVPDTMAKLLLDYHFTTGVLRNAGIYAGVQHEGNVAGENETGFTSLGVAEQPGFYLPPWAVVNMGVKYSWRNYRFNLNLDNATDARFYWQPAGRISVIQYSGPTVRLTVTVHI